MPAGRFGLYRGDRIRTCDLCDPNAALYQTELRPDNACSPLNNCQYAIMGGGKPQTTMPQQTPLTTPPVVIGIDAGGTSLRVAVAQGTTGASLAQAKAASSPDGGPETVALQLHDALRAAGVQAGSVGAVCAGITKWTRGDVKERWEAELVRLLPQTAGRISIVPDYVIAFHGAIASGRGITALAGTGSVVYGDDGINTPVRVGGRGWEWSDEGSGTWITSEVIRRTLRALDGIDTMTPLGRAVCERLTTTDAALLGEAARDRCVREGRGFLVPLVLAQAQSGDREACDLLVGAAGWLGAQVKAAHARLQWTENEPVPVAMVGGLWEAGDLLRLPFVRVLQRLVPQAQVISPQAAPVTGAVRLARLLLPARKR